MKKKMMSLALALVMCLSLCVPAFALETVSPVMEDSIPKGDTEIILEEYSLADSETVFTMELFEETYTREDVATMIAVEKAYAEPAACGYRSFPVTESEIDEVYDAVQALAARAPALSYYFQNVYWNMRYDSHYGSNTISLTLVPTNVTKNNHDLEVTMASWALAKAEVGHSSYWTNEGSLEQQFRCHALGEIYYPGDVGNWDLEPVRPNIGLIEYVINKCNPTD